MTFNLTRSFSQSREYIGLNLHLSHNFKYEPRKKIPFHPTFMSRLFPFFYIRYNMILVGIFDIPQNKNIKLGGLDVETNRDRDRERP